MKTLLRHFSIFLLLFIGLPACYSGIALMLEPSGKWLLLKTEWLKGSPFENYFVPGMLLFSAIGVLSIAVAFKTFLKNKKYPVYIFSQGIILTVWISVQVSIFSEKSFMQLFVGLSGIALILLGWMQKNFSYARR
jgi:hypothetical protein